MKFWVGVTDKDWFDFLSERGPDEVNFWQPSAKALTRALVPGTPFLFKLHSVVTKFTNHGIAGS